MDVVVKNITLAIQRITLVPSEGVPYTRSAAPGRYVTLTDEEYAQVYPLDPKIWELADSIETPLPPDPPPCDTDICGPTGATGPTGPAGPAGTAGLNGELIATMNWRFEDAKLIWDDPMYVSYPGLTNDRNTISPGFATFLNDDDILYVQCNLDAGAASILTPQINPVDTVSPVTGLFILARRYGNNKMKLKLPVSEYLIQP